jgi:threonine/homoserine/homoserine lactone efflux protein
MTGGAVLAFWGTSFLLVLTPGADWAYMINAGLRRRSVAAAVGGLLVGYVALTVLVAAGVAALVARSPEVLTGLTLVGAAYLVWLGAGAWRSAATSVPVPVGGATGDPGVALAVPGSGGGWLRQAATGAGTSGLNPKALLLFLALLPQFTDASTGWPVAVQIVLLGLVHVASCALVYTSVGLGARTLLADRPGLARWVTRASAVAMLGIGLGLGARQLLG